MARTFPFLPDTLGLDPAFSILEGLGVEDPAAGPAPAAGQALAEAVLGAVTPEDSGPAGALDFGVETAEEEANAPDLVPVIAALDLDSIAEAYAPLPAIQAAAGASSTHAAVDFASSAADLPAAAAGDSAPFDGAAEAKGGKPGGGGGGDGGGGGGALTEYRSGSPDGADGYDILIQFKGSGWTTDLQEAFIDAADYFTTVITDDIGGGGRIGKVLIDDLYVTAEVRAIDGEGGILGQAGPTNVWSANELAAAGKMQFDVADALAYFGEGLWDDIVTHELMHVLGFGSLWNYGDDPLVSGSQYLGDAGVAAYDAAITPGTQTYVPVEDGGGSGTAGAHWDEEALGNELMTGYIDGSNYLSKFSVMSLADLGYAVSYADYPYDAQLIA
jgi:hypothetical protein